jgi:hypothetical protein
VNRRARERAEDAERARAEVEQSARRQIEESWREYGAFIMEADEHLLDLIERFGVKALRNQLGENRDEYRRETKRWQQQHARHTMADALKVARDHPPYVNPNNGAGDG